METDFLGSFWKIIVSEISRLGNANENEKIVADLFSSTFVKMVQVFLSAAQKAELSALLAAQQIDDPFLAAAVNVLIKWVSNSDEINLASREFVSVVLQSAVIERLSSAVTRRLFESFFPPESLEELANRLDLDLIPHLVENGDKIRVLTGCQFLSHNVAQLMQTATGDISDCVRRPKDDDQLELILRSLVNMPRLVSLFRQVTDTFLKANFLTVIAFSIRNFGKTQKDLADVFFHVPGVGNVMDRWLDKELVKYNKTVFDVAKKFLSSGGHSHLEQFRAAVRPAFPDNDKDWISLPFGNNIDVLIGNCLEQKDPSFHALSCAMSAATIAQILAFFPSHFVLQDGCQARLTSAGMKTSFILSSVGVGAAAAAPNKSIIATPVGLDSEVAPSLEHLGTPVTHAESLVDILLKEQLSRLPQHLFLNRPYPTRVQPGVYRFGSREVTFHTKGGELFVYRVGAHVSESDAAAFLSREFDLAPVPVRLPQEDQNTLGGSNFKTRLCAMFQQGRCNRGSACGFAHGQAELRGGAASVTETGGQYYKTRMCNAFLEGRCNRGVGCSYAHSETERAAFATGVPRRDVRATQDLRLAEKLKAKQRSRPQDGESDDSEHEQRNMQKEKSRSRSPPVRIQAKPLPYIPPPKQAGSRAIDETEL